MSDLTLLMADTQAGLQSAIEEGAGELAEQCLRAIRDAAAALAAKDALIREMEAALKEERADVAVALAEARTTLAAKDAEIESLRLSLGRATADLMGTQDGALVRDQTVEIDGLRARLAAADAAVKAARKMYAAQQAEAKAQILSDQATERGDTQSTDRIREYARAAAVSSNAEREFRATLAAYDATKEPPHD